MLALALALTFSAARAASLSEAIALYDAKKYPEAGAALAKITAAEPKNAAASYYYGMTLRRRGDNTALDDAVPWLAKAAELEPNNATYLADYGGSALQLAGKTRSLSGANRGRDAMIRSLELNPDNLQAREGLMQFYSQAPWPVGSTSKAYAQAEEIRKRDPIRGLTALITLKSGEKKYADATELCESALKQNPDNYLALYQIGRLASTTGENLDRGLVTLRRCLELTPPPNQPGHSGAHFRIGVILEKKGDKPAARVAYEAALKLDPRMKLALDALAKL
jgi:tetratricopeptide (TPR) repeat protein